MRRRTRPSAFAASTRTCATTARSLRPLFPSHTFTGAEHWNRQEGQEKKLFPHFSAENLKLEGNPLIASFPVPKMEMPCAYTLRRPDQACVLEDAAVGDSFVHEWECDESWPLFHSPSPSPTRAGSCAGIIGKEYGFHIHSCYMIDGKDGEMLVLDAAGYASHSYHRSSRT